MIPIKSDELFDVRIHKHGQQVVFRRLARGTNSLCLCDYARVTNTLSKNYCFLRYTRDNKKETNEDVKTGWILLA